MAQTDEIKEKMTELFRKKMREAAIRQAEARIDAHIKFVDTWYSGEWTVDLIRVTVVESYESFADTA